MTTQVQDDMPVLAMPNAWLGVEMARRATCLALALDLVRGRSVPIQVVERLAHWLYDGEGAAP